MDNKITEGKNKPSTNNIFYGVNSNLVYCINDNYTKYYLLNENNIFICSDTCYN